MEQVVIRPDRQWPATRATMLLTAWPWPRPSSTPCCRTVQPGVPRVRGHLPPSRAQGQRLEALWRLPSP